MMKVMDGTPSQMSLGPWNDICYVNSILLGYRGESC